MYIVPRRACCAFLIAPSQQRGLGALRDRRVSNKLEINARVDKERLRRRSAELRSVLTLIRYTMHYAALRSAARRSPLGTCPAPSHTDSCVLHTPGRFTSGPLTAPASPSRVHTRTPGYLSRSPHGPWLRDSNFCRLRTPQLLAAVHSKERAWG
ncbi:hypothetical protein NDU88_003386 [Pleurodeles waltl]|uniref:Uncharacterized protein n=1 Tax=Pleurodeles waltl TaxID=8319 RepID=A0AAV7T5M7_PLEWA|nr:hypothetical protein NDU88_003386 [Pleurodeles waltl]